MTPAPYSIPPLFLRLGLCVITLVIFVIDTLTSLNIAVAVLYILVILFSMNSFSVRGVRLVALACGVLTLGAFLLSHWDDLVSTALARCLVSLVAIAIAAALALKSKRASDDLQEQLSLLAQTHDAIIVCSWDCTIRIWNTGAEKLYGWKASEVIGRNCWELLRSQASIPLEVIRGELLDNGIWEGELLEATREGHKVNILSRWSLSRDSQGQPKSILATNNDITDVRLAEEALHHSQAQLAHVSRVTMVGELAASIAHEVNQPLAAITTYGEAALRWLSRPVPNLEEACAAVERMGGDARRASEVIRRIRGLLNKSEPHYELLDIDTLVSESLSLLEREIQRHHVRLFLKVEPRLPRVLGDRIQLQQVLINLVMNGIQALACRDDRARELQVHIHAQGEQAVVAVQDSGGGIQAEHLPMLFNAFFTTKQDGMGIGLSICRSIIEVHGGRIWADSTLGEGATLSFSLPAAPAMEVTA